MIFVMVNSLAKKADDRLKDGEEVLVLSQSKIPPASKRWRAFVVFGGG
jgi:hypothetical protein